MTEDPGARLPSANMASYIQGRLAHPDLPGHRVQRDSGYPWALGVTA